MIQSLSLFRHCCAVDEITDGGKILPDWPPNPLPNNQTLGVLLLTNYSEGEMLLAARVCKREKAICDHQNELVGEKESREISGSRRGDGNMDNANN